MGLFKISFLVTTLFCLSFAWPRKARSDESSLNFIGRSTNDLSRSIIQSYVDDDSNLAFSPFGYSVILAIVSEGAKGETRDQLSAALRLPEDITVARKMYQVILTRLKNTNEYKTNRPEFKNWFYVYKNYTIQDDYKAVLEKYYLTDVRSVNKYDASFYKAPEETVEKVVQDPLPPVVITHISEKNEVNKEDNEKIISFAMEDKPSKPASELYESTEKKPGKNIKEKIKLANTFKKNHEGGDYEIMEAVEATNHERTARNMKDIQKEGTQGLSANRVGNNESNSLMIIFNGLYFKGTWKTPFVKISDDDFYIKSKDIKKVPMMNSKGKFKMGTVPGLSSSAIELPYEGDRYSLVIIKPNERDGLRKLSENLADFPLSSVSDVLYPTEVTVRMPFFYVETTTKPLAALAKFGASMIFSPKANLSGISTEKGLFVQEMVQHVSIRIDDSSSSISQISAGNPSTILERSTPLEEENETSQDIFSINHPFLFFVKDTIDNIIVVAGKVTNPIQPDPFDEE